jgi:hypothetical protein
MKLRHGGTNPKPGSLAGEIREAPPRRQEASAAQSKKLTYNYGRRHLPPPLAAGIAGENNGGLDRLTLSPLGYCSRRRGERGDKVEPCRFSLR